MSLPATGIEYFRSSTHPDNRSRTVLFAEKWIRVLATLFLPFMILITVFVLQHRPVLLFSVLSFASTFVLASAWTLYDLKQTIAEVRIYADDTVSLVSAWNCYNESDTIGGQVLDVRRNGDTLFVAVNDTVYRLERVEWPDFDRLVGQLARLRMAANTSTA